MTATNEAPKVERRVRITVEGRVALETGPCLYIESGDHVTNRIRKAGAVIEELTTPYDWRDGDVVQTVTRNGDTLTIARHAGVDPATPWHASDRYIWTDAGISELVDGGLADGFPTVRILRYQAGGIGS